MMRLPMTNIADVKPYIYYGTPLKFWCFPSYIVFIDFEYKCDNCNVLYYEKVECSCETSIPCLKMRVNPFIIYLTFLRVYVK